MRRFIKTPHIVSTLALSGFAFIILTGNGQPLFTNLDTFVLFAQGEVRLEKEVQVSSGDVGSNGKIDIEKDVIVNGNLFAKEIAIDKNSTINGNASFNKIKLNEKAQIFGIQTKSVQLPIASLPSLPNFSIGVQDLKFIGQNNSLLAGSYRDIIVEKNSKLVLTGGAYNLRKLELRDDAVLIFDAQTVINIQFKFRGHNKIFILPGLNLKPDDLTINYLGIKPKKDKKEIHEDDDDEIEAEMDDKEKKEHKAGKIGRPVVFGKESFLNFKLLAPKVSVKIGEQTTFRGQIVARKVKMGKGSILSREKTVVKGAKPEDIVTDLNGGVYPVSEILINLTLDSTFEDAVEIASVINGRVVGVVSSINLYKVEVSVNTISGIESVLTVLQNLSDPRIEGVFRNFLVPVE